MFEALKTRRRIILSGTPIQNNLSEFHSMADFCNPGLMGRLTIEARTQPLDMSILDEYTTFKRVYETPILLARAPNASPRTRELGEARVEQASGGVWKENWH
jgi:DNA repair and recombination protein RAD54B